MGKPPTLRLFATVALALLPPGVALGAMAVTGALWLGWVVLALGVGIGWFAARWIARTWQTHADRLGAIAEALEHRQPPSHLMPDGRDALSTAERRILEATDTISSEIESLDEQREEFEAILRSMTEAVVVTGAHGEVVLLNGAARRLFGLQAETSYRGRDFVELCRDPRLQEFVGRATGSGDSAVISAEVLIQNPAPRYLEASAAPMRRVAGAAARVFVFHDITRLKSYETMRTDFIANLTHELRTPLTALYGYAETLQKGVDDRDTERRFLQIIERQSRRLARLIDDLISLSDLERGLTPLKLEALLPGGVLEDAAELMHDQAQRSGVTLVVKASPDLPNVHGDRDRLNQVMINLLDNALKYTPRGGSVTLEAQAALDGVASHPGESAAHPGVELIVADTGEGIPAADIPRLTERFYRVDRARSRELGGTGLGLAIVKHIVQLHSGQLKIESRLREGTTVTVWLPAAGASTTPRLKV